MRWSVLLFLSYCRMTSTRRYNSATTLFNSLEPSHLYDNNVVVQRTNYWLKQSERVRFYSWKVLRNFDVVLAKPRTAYQILLLV